MAKKAVEIFFNAGRRDKKKTKSNKHIQNFNINTRYIRYPCIFLFLYIVYLCLSNTDWYFFFFSIPKFQKNVYVSKTRACILSWKLLKEILRFLFINPHLNCSSIQHFKRGILKRRSCLLGKSIGSCQKIKPF